MDYDLQPPTDAEVLRLARDARNAGQIAGDLTEADQALVKHWEHEAIAAGLPDEHLDGFRLGLYVAVRLLRGRTV